MPRSDLPFGSEFSPSQIGLRKVLEIARGTGGDWRTFEAAIHDAYFSRHATTEANRRKLADNCKLAMIAYGLIDRDARLTEFGERLYGIRDDEPSLHAELARHILKNLHGTTLVQCVLDMQAGAETVDLEKLRQWLGERGIHFPRGGKHPSIMRLWLEKAGIFVDGWRVDESRLREVLGISIEEIEAISRLTSEQRAYLRALANISAPGPYLSNDVEKLAAATYGVKFSEKNLPKTVLYPLADAGFVTLIRGTAPGGRGGKPFLVSGTEKLQVEVVLPLLAQFEQLIDSELRPFLRRPLAEVLADLTAPEKHVRGLALEALGIKLMRLIDMKYVTTRLRGAATGGAEVDIIFENSRLVFSRWQIQCKNTDRVSLDDVAKEVGLTHMLKGKVIVVVGTGEIAPDALSYAKMIGQKLALNVCCLGGPDLQAIATSPGSLVTLLTRQAPLALCQSSEFLFLIGPSQHDQTAAVTLGR